MTAAAVNASAGAACMQKHMHAKAHACSYDTSDLQTAFTNGLSQQQQQIVEQLQNEKFSEVICLAIAS